MSSRVLFIFHIPPPINGSAIMGKRIMESEYINNAFNADYINLTTSFSLKKIGKGGGSKMLTVFKILTKVIKVHLTYEYDICYMTLTAKGIGFYKDLLVVSILKLFGTKIIYHFHNKGIKENSKKGILNFLYRFTFKNTQSILSSKFLYHDIEKYVKKENVFFCGNGIPDITDYQPIKETPAKDEPCKFLFLSNMMKTKGVYVLLDSCKILQEKKMNFKCHFVGAWSDISNEDFDIKVNEYGLNRTVRAHGPKYGENKIAYFKNSDAFIFPTYNEVFGLVNLEAMQQSLPVISTLEGSIPDVVKNGETGYLVNPKNSFDLAEKMELLIREPDLRNKMGLAGRKRYEEYYTFSTFETKLASILQQTIKK